MSCTRSKFASVYSSLRSASFFCALYFVIPCRLFENRPPILGSTAQDEIDLALLHDRVGASPDTGIHEELVNIAQPARRLVEEILALAIAENASGNADLVPFDAQVLFRTRQTSSKPQPCPSAGRLSVPLKMTSAISPPRRALRRLLAQHPPNRIQEHSTYRSRLGPPPQ